MAEEVIVKLSCLPVSLFPDLSTGRVSLKEWALLGKGMGLDAIDVGITLIRAHTPVYLEQVARDLADAGMTIAMVTTYPDFTNPSEAQRDRELQYLCSDIAVASQLRARYLRVTAGQNHPGTAIEHQMRTAVGCLTAAAAVADRLGVRLVLENHSKPSAWHWYDLTYDPAVFLAVAHALEGTSIHVNFDTANVIAAGGDPIRVLREVASRVETIHAADIRAAGTFEPVVIGSGCVPFLEIFRVLRMAGFDGWICIEEWSNTGRAGIREAVRFIREAWEVSDMVHGIEQPVYGDAS